MVRAFALTIALAAAVFAGCATEEVSGCLEPPSSALDQLDVELTDPVSVEAVAFKGPAELKGEAHYVGGRVDGKTVIWIFGERAYDGDDGVIIAADQPTRELSDVGDEKNPPQTDLGPGDDDYSNIRDCIN
ncbi:MAG: hypothetical protein ACR2OC_13555 [Solirubrobacterales bacterium]